MPRSAYIGCQEDLFDALDEYPEFIVNYEEQRNGSYAIRLFDCDSGETFEL